MDNSHKTMTPAILSGWKEIAHYLGKGIRTVQRYELELGLPIRRFAGKSRASVAATKAELDAWVTASPLRQSLPLRGLPESFVATMDGVKTLLAEHHQLLEKMTKHRGEMIDALELLRANIRAIQTYRSEESVEYPSPVISQRKPHAQDN